MRIEEYSNPSDFLWTTKSYFYKSWNFTLSCNCPCTSDYLHTYLKAYFDEEKSIRKRDWNIWVIVDDRIYSDFVGQTDKENTEYSMWQEDTGCITIENKAQTERWHIAQETMNHLGLVQDVYCRIRRTCISYIEKMHKSLLFHGACVCKDEHACIVLGDKGMGKSYMTDRLLFQKGWSYVAADQTIVIYNDEKILEVRGNITSYRMNKNDFQLSQLERYKKIITFSIDDNYVYKVGKVNVPPSYLNDCFQIQCKQNIPLKTVIIISNTKYELEKMGIEDKIKLLLKFFISDLNVCEERKDEYSQETALFIAKHIIDKCSIYSVEKKFDFDLVYQELFFDYNS